MPTEYYVPSQRYKKLEYEEVGVEGPSITVLVRTSLTVAENDSLNADAETPMVEAYQKYAPFVVEWNVAELNDKGKVVPVPAPGSGGPEMFEKIPSPLFFRIANDLRRVVVKPVDPKPSTPPVSTDEP